MLVLTLQHCALANLGLDLNLQDKPSCNLIICLPKYAWKGCSSMSPPWHPVQESGGLFVGVAGLWPKSGMHWTQHGLLLIFSAASWLNANLFCWPGLYFADLNHFRAPRFVWGQCARRYQQVHLRALLLQADTMICEAVPVPALLSRRHLNAQMWSYSSGALLLALLIPDPCACCLHGSQRRALSEYSPLQTGRSPGDCRGQHGRCRNMGRFLAVLALLAASVPLGPATVLQPVNLLSESVFLRHAKLIGSEVQVWTETHSSEGMSKLWMSAQSLSQCIALFTREPCHAELADVILFFCL